MGFLKNLVVPIFTFILMLKAQQALGEEVIVGVEDIQYLPHYSFENGQYKGMARDLFDAFAQDTGHIIKYKAMNVDNLMFALVNGEIDLKYPAHSDWSPHIKKDKVIVYSNRIFPYLDGLMTLPKNKNLPLKKIKNIGSIQGFSPQSYEKLRKNKIVSFLGANTIDELIDMLNNQEVNAIYANVDVVVSHFLSSGIQNLKSKKLPVFVRKLPHIDSHYRAATTHRLDLIQEFNTWMYNNPDILKTIARKYKVEFSM